MGLNKFFRWEFDEKWLLIPRCLPGCSKALECFGPWIFIKVIYHC